MEYKYCIIVDEDKKPMAWGGDQLCYCTDDTWQDEPFPVKIYTKERAKVLIRKSKEYRRKNKFTETFYKTMPVRMI